MQKYIKNENKNVPSLMLVFLFFSLFPIYIYSSKVFWYIGYYQYTGISSIRFFMGTLLVFFFSYYGRKIDSGFIKLTYYICLIFLLYGEIISFVCDNSVNLTMIIIISVFLLLLPLTGKINADFKLVSELNDDTRAKLILLVSLVLFLPFLKHISQINLNNLMLKDIYETRTLFKNTSIGSSIIGYIKEPLARVLLPILLVIGIEEKKRYYIVLSSAMILYIFLCGGLKSILFGLASTLIFYKGDYNIKLSSIIRVLTITGVIGLLLYYCLNYDLVISMFRRLFILPARLNKYYVDYFKDNWTYYRHSGLAFNQDPKYAIGISNYVGDEVIGTGTNANTGIFVEGYYSFGLFGGLLYLFIPLFLIMVLNSIKFDGRFYGIFFVYLYYFNTAILSTLLLTHGLLFFIVMAFLSMRSNKRQNDIKEMDGEIVIERKLKDKFEKKSVF